MGLKIKIKMNSQWIASYQLNNPRHFFPLDFFNIIPTIHKTLISLKKKKNLYSDRPFYRIYSRLCEFSSLILNPAVLL